MELLNSSLELSKGLLSPATPNCVCRDMLSKKQWKIIKSLNKDTIVASKSLTKSILLEFLIGNNFTRGRIGNSKLQLAQMTITLMKSLLCKNVTETSKQSNTTPSSRSSEQHDTRSHHVSDVVCTASLGDKSCNCVIDVQAFLQEVRMSELCPQLMHSLCVRPHTLRDEVTSFLQSRDQLVSSTCCKRLLEQLKQYLLQNSFVAPAALNNITFRRKKKTSKITQTATIEATPSTNNNTTNNQIVQSAPPKIALTFHDSHSTALTFNFNNLTPARTSTPSTENKQEQLKLNNSSPEIIYSKINIQNSSNVSILVPKFHIYKDNTLDRNFPIDIQNITSRKKIGENKENIFVNNKKDITIVLKPEKTTEVQEKKKENVKEIEGYKKPTVAWMMKTKEKQMKEETTKSGSNLSTKLPHKGNWCTCNLLNDCRFIACKHFTRCNICAKCHMCHRKIVSNNMSH